MATERTFGIVKPDAVAKNAIGGVIDMVETSGLRVVGLKRLHMSQSQAEGFYAVHKARPFFGDLVRFMTSGPCVVMAIEGENAVARYREVMGPTDSKKAPAGTIRAKFGTDIEKNAVHGSDATDTARDEIGFSSQPQNCPDCARVRVFRGACEVSPRAPRTDPLYLQSIDYEFSSIAMALGGSVFPGDDVLVFDGRELPGPNELVRR